MTRTRGLPLIAIPVLMLAAAVFTACSPTASSIEVAAETTVVG